LIILKKFVHCDGIGGIQLCLEFCRMLYIDYDLLNARKEKVLAVATDGSSTWQRSGGEVAAIINPFVNIFVTDSALGQAWIGQWQTRFPSGCPSYRSILKSNSGGK
jgi:hypothetical protein